MLHIRADLTALKLDGEAKAACPHCRQQYADDECYCISENSPWEIDAFVAELRSILKEMEAGRSGLYGGREMSIIPALLTIRIWPPGYKEPE